MAMQSHSGVLTDVGPIQQRKGGVNLVYIDIGTHALKDVKSTPDLADFLLRAQTMEGNTTLWVHHRPIGRTLMGVQLPNGKRLLPDINSQIMLMLGLLLIPAYLIGYGLYLGGGGVYLAAFGLLGFYAPWRAWREIQTLRKISRGEFP